MLSLIKFSQKSINKLGFWSYFWKYTHFLYKKVCFCCFLGSFPNLFMEKYKSFYFLSLTDCVVRNINKKSPCASYLDHILAKNTLFFFKIPKFSCFSSFLAYIFFIYNLILVFLLQICTNLLIDNKMMQISIIWVRFYG